MSSFASPHRTPTCRSRDSTRESAFLINVLWPREMRSEDVRGECPGSTPLFCADSETDRCASNPLVRNVLMRTSPASNDTDKADDRAQAPLGSQRPGSTSEWRPWGRLQRACDHAFACSSRDRARTLQQNRGADRGRNNEQDAGEEGRDQVAIARHGGSRGEVEGHPEREERRRA